MKARKIFGVLFTILGSMTVFLSLAALILPLVANQQMNLVLESFYRPSDNFLVNLINTLMSFLLENSVLMLVGGAAILLVGVLLLLSAARLEEEQSASKRSAERAQAAQPRPAPVWKRQAPSADDEPNPFAAPANDAADAPQAPEYVPVTAEPDFQVTQPETVARPSVSAPPKPQHSEEDIAAMLAPAEEPYAMGPDDVFYSPGTARRLSRTEAPQQSSPTPLQERESFMPLFSTAPAAKPVAHEEEPVPVPVAEPAPAPAPVAQKPKVKIKSTMGKHTV